MQSQWNSIEDDDNVKLLSAHIRKIQITPNVETTISTKAEVDGRRLDISIKRLSYIIGKYNTDYNLSKKVYN